MTGQGTLPLFGPRPERELPLIYVATRLTHLSGDPRSVVEGWCYVIEDVITRFTSEDPPWFARCHLPIRQSAPWIDDGRTSGDVYWLNSDLLWNDVDALIVLTYKGGSLGAGHELTTAATLGIPTLLVAQKSEPVSRHIEGFAAEHVITCETFTTPERLRDIVDAWLRREPLFRTSRRGSDKRLKLQPTNTAGADARYSGSSARRARNLRNPASGGSV